MLKLHSSIAISCWLPRLRSNSWIGVVFFSTGFWGVHQLFAQKLNSTT